MGYNGSENFKSGERFGVFPAGAIGYLISNEPFWKVKWINHMKIRGSIGLVGSDVLAAGRFAYLSTWESGLGGHYFGPNATWSAGIGEAQEGVLGLTWEKGLKKDLGLELKMFDSMVSIDLDYFHEKRWDILIQRSSVPGIAGLNQQPLANMGRMTNHGFEATAEFNHHIGKVNYRIYGNFSFARNKITEKDEAPTDPWRMRTGTPLNQQFGLIALGLFEDQDEIDLSPEQKFGTVRPGDVKYLDYNGLTAWSTHTTKWPSAIRAFRKSTTVSVCRSTGRVSISAAFFRGQAHVSYSLGGSFFPFANGVGQGQPLRQGDGPLVGGESQPQRVLSASVGKRLGQQPEGLHAYDLRRQPAASFGPRSGLHLPGQAPQVVGMPVAARLLRRQQPAALLALGHVGSRERLEPTVATTRWPASSTSA